MRTRLNLFVIAMLSLCLSGPVEAEDIRSAPDFTLTDANGQYRSATYGQTDVGLTSFEKLSGGAPVLTSSQREFSYYDISAGYNLLPGESIPVSTSPRL